MPPRNVAQPIDVLRAGTGILDPILLPHGFRWEAERTGKGSGGEFALGEYVRGDRRLELWFRHALGGVTYHIWDKQLDHETYMEALRVPRGENQYPGFPDDLLGGFRRLAHDLSAYCEEFLAGDASVLRAIAQTAAELASRTVSREDMASAVGDDRKRADARRLFRAGEYARAVAAFEAIQYPDLLSASEKATLAIARRRARRSS